MSHKIQIKRGLQANLPALDVGEIGFTTDQKRTYIGSAQGNVELAKASDLADIASRKNEWLRGLGDAVYVAHKGFNGYVSGTTSPGVVPSNSNLAFELAGQLGHKVIETDVQVLADGTWVVYHDKFTDSRLTGASAIIYEIDLANFKSRKFYREYMEFGGWWNYTGELANCTPLTFEEYLLIAKKHGMYVMPEIKWSDKGYTATDFANFAATVKKVGMEDRTIVLSAYMSFVKSVMQHLPNAIASPFLSETQAYLDDIKPFKNVLGTVGAANYTPSMEAFCKTNNIPVNVWTIDKQKDAEALFKRGARLVTTNSLLNHYDTSDYQRVTREMTATIFGKTLVSKSDGDSSIDSNGAVQFTTANYNERYFVQSFSTLKRGDIIKLKATAKIDKADPAAVARMFITNAASGTNRRESLIEFDKNEYETKEIVYIVNDSTPNITIQFGVRSANGITSAGHFKDMEYTIYTIDDALKLSNERMALIYQFGTNAHLFRPSTVKKGINSVYVDPGDTGLLCVDYVPFKNWQGNPLVFVTMTDYSTNFAYRVYPVVDNATNGTVKLKVYNAAGARVTDVSANLNLGFSILIQNY